MVLFVGYHYSRRTYRRSILKRGLIRHAPKMGTPCGVYVFSPYVRNNDAHVRWGDWHLHVVPNVEMWRVAYCGPVRTDELVQNSIILPSVTAVTLVTGNE